MHNIVARGIVHIVHIHRTENFYHFIRNLIFNSILGVFKLHTVGKSENAVRRTDEHQTKVNMHEIRN